MNCRQFQDCLYEYVEGTLSATTQAGADRHLAACHSCRVAVQQEQQFAQNLSARLRQDAETLTLRPEVRQAILRAARRQPAPLGMLEFLAGLWNRFARPMAIAVPLLLVVMVLVIWHFSGTRIHEMPTARADGRHPPSALSTPPAVSIQISCRRPAYQFRREGNWVVDTLSCQTVVASGTVQPGGQPPIPKQTATKMPL
jgi:anti-sigma factor RsiW